MPPINQFQWRVFVPVAVLAAAGVLVWWVLIGPPGHLGAHIADPEPTIAAEVFETPTPSEWSNLASGAIPSSVAIQTFSGNRVARFGTGTIVSSDGLIVTVVDVVPVTSPSAVYQIVLNNRILRAHVVKRDFSRNLALLKANVADLTIAQMTQTRPLLGAPLALVGGIVDVSVYAPFFSHAWLSYDVDRYGVLDADYRPTLAGARVLALDGRQVGIVFLRAGQVRVTWTERIDAFIQEYLNALDADN